jgi:hypothetical protein
MSEENKKESKHSRKHPKLEAAEKERYIVVTPGSILLTLNDELREQMHHCLYNSGKIIFSIKEISLTELPATLLQNGDGGVTVD